MIERILMNAVVRAAALTLVLLAPPLETVTAAPEKIESTPVLPETRDALAALVRKANELMEERKAHRELISETPPVMASTLSPETRRKTIVLAHEWIGLLDAARSELKKFARENKDALPKCARRVEHLSRPDYEHALARFEAKPMTTARNRFDAAAAALPLEGLFAASMARFSGTECMAESLSNALESLPKAASPPEKVEGDD